MPFNGEKIIRIHIGEYHADKTSLWIYTLLGSCVSVCLYDRVQKIGGMNHILLPGEADLSRYDAPARYGVNAMELLINKIIKLGGNRKYFIAKIFGGAQMLHSFSLNSGVGDKIVEFVHEFLDIENIPIAAGDTGGTDTRKIYFHTTTGNVMLKRVRSALYADLAKKERSVADRIHREINKPGDITLF